jgi:hypothetical protein
LRAPDSTRSRLFLVFGLLGALSLLSSLPLLGRFGTSLPSDLGDPILNSWIFWWNAHQVPLTAGWWNAPMFAPMPGTFALSETMLSLWPLTTPLQWLGANPIAAYNAVFLLSYPMAGIGAYWLALRLTRRWDASLVCALAYAFNPYRIAQLPHVQMEWSCWMPLALAALHEYIAPASANAAGAAAPAGKRRALFSFGVCWMLNGFTNGYVLVYFPILVGCWMLWFVRRWRDAFAIGAAAAIASLPIAPMLIGYATRQQLFGFSRSIGEIRIFSADVTAIFASAPRALSSYWTVRPGPEGELYPGLAIVGLIIVGLIISVRANRSAAARSAAAAPVPRRAPWSPTAPHVRRVVIALAIVSATLAVLVILTGGSELRLGPLSLSVHRPSRLLTFAFWFGVIALVTSASFRRAWSTRSAFAFYAVAAGVMYFFALGPEPHWGATQILYKPPYAWLMYLPGFDSVRVPARFGLLMMLCLSAAAALAYARIFTTPSRARAALISLAVLAEGWIVMPVAALPPVVAVPPRILSANASILELPVSGTFEGDTIALYNSLHHGRPLINGFSGYLPTHYYALRLALDNLDATVFDAVRADAPVGIYIDAARDRPRPDDDEPNPPGAQLALVAAIPGVQLIDKTDRGSWFLLPQEALPPAPVTAGIGLAPSSVDVTSTPELAGALTDGLPSTRWFGAIHGESSTDTIALNFAQPIRPDVVEIDQGNWAASYSRDLEIVAVTDAGRVTLYRGSLAAKAIRAALASKDVAIKIAVPNAPETKRIELICHPPFKKFTWSVGEIRIYGK